MDEDIFRATIDAPYRALHECGYAGLTTRGVTAAVGDANQRLVSSVAPEVVA